MTLRDLPNIISVLRILLVLPVVWLILQQQYLWALILFAIAGVSDALDGFLAKHFHWESRLGSVLDPLADKLLLVSSYLSLGWLALIPGWLVLAVLLRDLIIVAGALAFHYLIGRYDMQPSWLSKLNTAFQIAVVLAVVIFHAGLAFNPTVLAGLFDVVLATTVLSGLHYIYIWSRRALRERRRGDGHA